MGVGDSGPTSKTSDPSPHNSSPNTVVSYVKGNDHGSYPNKKRRLDDSPQTSSPNSGGRDDSIDELDAFRPVGSPSLRHTKMIKQNGVPIHTKWPENALHSDTPSSPPTVAGEDASDKISETGCSSIQIDTNLHWPRVADRVKQFEGISPQIQQMEKMAPPKKRAGVVAGMKRKGEVPAFFSPYTSRLIIENSSPRSKVKVSLSLLIISQTRPPNQVRLDQKTNSRTSRPSSHPDRNRNLFMIIEEYLFPSSWRIPRPNADWFSSVSLTQDI